MADAISTTSQRPPTTAIMPEPEAGRDTDPETTSPDLSRWQRFAFSTTHGILSALLLALRPTGLYWFGRAFGTCEWLINFKRRWRFHAALERVLGRKPTLGERIRQTREHFMRSRCDKLFYMIFDRIPRSQAETMLAIDNEELLHEVVQRGRGVYVALAHQSSIHVVGMLLCLRGYKVVGVRDRKEGGLRRFIQQRFDLKYPEFGRARIIFSDSFPREIFRCFKEGYLLGSAMDVSRVRHANQKTEEVTFLGERQLFLSGPMWAALRCKSPIVQGFLIPEKGFRYRFRLAEWLIDPAKVDFEEVAIAVAMQKYATNVECFLKENPSLITRI